MTVFYNDYRVAHSYVNPTRGNLVRPTDELQQGNYWSSSVGHLKTDVITISSYINTLEHVELNQLDDVGLFPSRDSV